MKLGHPSPPAKRIVLFLNENPLPPVFTRGTVSAKELRLRAALPDIDEVHVLARRGAYVASHHQDQTPLEEKVIVHLLPPWPYYLAAIPLFFGGWWLARRLRPLTIEAESPILSGPAAVLLGRLLGIPSVVEIRASYKRLLKFRFRWLSPRLKLCLYNAVQSFCLRRAAVIIANSRKYQADLKHLHFDSVVINPGVQYLPKKIPVYHPPKDHRTMTVGYLGRLVPEKGIGYFLIAVQTAARATSVPFRVEIAGDGPERAHLETQANDLGIRHLVTFLGQVDNFTTLGHWDLLVNPCLVNHPLEMVNAEAAAMGIPVICFGNATVPETVADHETGLKVGDKEPRALAQALITLIESPGLCREYSANARRFAEKNYVFADQVERLRQVYTSLTA